MHITKVYNISLLNVIKSLNECSVDELKKAYLPPEQPGVIHGTTLTFESDLKTLEDMAYIKIIDGRIKPI